MNRIFGTLLLCGIAVRAAAQTQEVPLAPAVECHPRQGLPRFFAKARTPGAEVRIAYLGGSITVGDLR